MSTPKFFYFDLGKVLLDFDHRHACRRVAAISGVSAERVWDVVFASGLELRYEAGAIDDRAFYESFCQAADARPDREAFERAHSDIFSPNIPLWPIVSGLAAAGYRLGILSNTCPAHWRVAAGGRFGLIPIT